MYRKMAPSHLKYTVVTQVKVKTRKNSEAESRRARKYWRRASIKLKAASAFADGSQTHKHRRKQFGKRNNAEYEQQSNGSWRKNSVAESRRARKYWRRASLKLKAASAFADGSQTQKRRKMLRQHRDGVLKTQSKERGGATKLRRQNSFEESERAKKHWRRASVKLKAASAFASAVPEKRLGSGYIGGDLGMGSTTNNNSAIAVEARRILEEIKKKRTNSNNKANKCKYMKENNALHRSDFSITNNNNVNNSECLVIDDLEDFDTTAEEFGDDAENNPWNNAMERWSVLDQKSAKIVAKTRRRSNFRDKQHAQRNTWSRRFRQAVNSRINMVVGKGWESPTLIVPGIYLGDRRDAANINLLQKLCISHVLNCAKQLPNYHKHDFVYCNLDVLDKLNANIEQYFPTAVAFIHAALQKRTGVLVHCIAGVSRSTSCLIAYLMYYKNMRLVDAYHLVKSKRPIIMPNKSFRLQLAQFEIDIFGDSSVAQSASKVWNFYKWNKVKGTVPVWKKCRRKRNSTVADQEDGGMSSAICVIL